MAGKNKNNGRREILGEIEETFGLIPEWVAQMPDGALGGFWAMFRDFYFAETQIPAKYKELIGLAVAGATRCHYCAYFHTENARLFGASDAEIAEASMMAGVSMQGSTFINAQQIDHDQFVREHDKIVEHLRQTMLATGAQRGGEAQGRPKQSPRGH